MELTKRHLPLALILGSLTHCADLGRDAGEPPAGWCESHMCETSAVTFAPEGGLRKVLDHQLSRLRDATGRTDIQISDDGVPVLFREHLLSQAPNPETGEYFEACGQTLVVGFGIKPNLTQAIYIDPTPAPGCPSWGISLLHELVHALANQVDHVPFEGSLFSEVCGTPWLDVDAMVQLCSGFDCHEFVPEEKAR